MWTSPQRMLLEMDERTRMAQRQAQTGDPEALQAYYLQIARSGGAQTVRRLAVLGDPVAKEVMGEGLASDEMWSVISRIEKDIVSTNDHELAIMIIDEIVDTYEEFLSDPDFGFESGYEPEYVNIVREYYQKYQQCQKTGMGFDQLEDALHADMTSGGRLYPRFYYDPEDRLVNYVLDAIGFACLVRISGIAGGPGGTGSSAGAQHYLGNALGAANKLQVSAAGILDKVRDKLQAQIF